MAVAAVTYHPIVCELHVMKMKLVCGLETYELCHIVNQGTSFTLQANVFRFQFAWRFLQV